MARSGARAPLIAVFLANDDQYPAIAAGRRLFPFETDSVFCCCWRMKNESGGREVSGFSITTKRSVNIGVVG